MPTGVGVIKRISWRWRTYARRYQSVRELPEFVAARRRAHWQAFCLTCFMPLAFLAFKLCQHLGWSGSYYVPIVCCSAFAAATFLGSLIADKREPPTRAPLTKP